MTGHYTAPNTQSKTIQLAFEMMSRPSVTPDDKGCQDIILHHLEPLGFVVERLQFGEVSNLWARKGEESPLFVFAGHTDVVPSGPETLWNHPPFEPIIDDGFLCGRGAADMKGSIAAFIAATTRFLEKRPDHKGSIGFLITSDEEGPARDGTRKVMETLEARGEKIDWCLVGEPSSTERLGDIIKNGRRGSLHGHLTIKGIQGHVAYPHLARNPVHDALPALLPLTTEKWDDGNEFFPPTTFQITNLHSGTGASNVIPGEIKVDFNFRYSTELTRDRIEHRVARILDDSGIDYQLDWELSGRPFLTEPGPLVDATMEAIESVTGNRSSLSTSGGTSDGRFIAPTGARVIELGPVNATIHKVNERVKVSDLDQLTSVYEEILTRLLASDTN
ncbi:MAG: succinyl-diaminopimelate desuccinylase [Gammaproteobacteria bacterium]|nr:MAG: succinyl-diaminopimelate desuccinylase [Pseudomonadota bacterium]PIE39014.1 MAG: succinyl-diaminopimelate desuccinylase [Gammaproteobacteria bacterium]